jgi:hypothetical protein
MLTLNLNQELKALNQELESLEKKLTPDTTDILTKE